MPRLRPAAVQRGYVTPGDFVRDRFGDQPGGQALVVAVGILMALALANFLLAPLNTMG